MFTIYVSYPHPSKLNNRVYFVFEFIPSYIPPLMEDLIPPGFRFYPTEEELISFYLHHKLEQTRPELNDVIPIVDIYALEPWELPRLVGERCSRETEQWFFFTPQQEREARGGKPNRTTASGYWKATGSPGYVVSSSQKRAIGVKKTMVFYKGRAPTGRKTKWKMNEYKSILGTPQENIPSSSNNASTMPKLRHEMSLCRVYITSGSSRAFDRRPSTLTIRRPIPDAPSGPAAPAAPTPACASDVNFTEAVPDKSSSASGSSSYRGEERVVVDNRQMEDAGSSNNIDVMSHEILSGLEPFWEWEQLNWP